MVERLFHLIFRDKPAKALIALANGKKQTYASSLARETDCTYPHIVKILAEFKRQGLIKVSSKGRIKPITLTRFGRKASAKLKEFETLCRVKA